MEGPLVLVRLSLSVCPSSCILIPVSLNSVLVHVFMSLLEGAMNQRFFSSRVVEDWSELEDETVSAGAIRDFKTKLG